MRADWSRYRSLPFPLQLLLFSQFAFNVGFYLVVPFLASYFEEDLKLTGGLIGIILGLRTFAQQGLFFLGGAITDWLGVKPVVLAGVGIRVLGFLTLALTRELGFVIVGVALIGVAAALFSPASESAIVGLAGDVEAAGGPKRTMTLSLQHVFSQAGSATGPALGGILWFAPFQVTCGIAAALFAVVGLMHLTWLPSGLRVGAPSRVRDSLAGVLRNRAFLALAGINCVMLIGYNQMYLALPVELTRSGLPSTRITWFFLLASVFVIAGQSTVTRLVDPFPVQTVLRLGYLAIAASFLVIAAVAWFPPPGGVLRVLPLAGFVMLLHLGSMVTGPRIRDTVARLAGEQTLGVHLGAMASAGGIGVLVAGGPIGSLLEAARVPGPPASIPWLILALLPLASSLAIGPVLRRIDPRR